MSLATPIPWNVVAEGYDSTTRHALAAFAQQALDWVDPAADARVLDVACGPGTLTVLAAARASRVLAVDFSEAMLTLCRRHTAGLDNVEVRQADGQALGIDAAFDVAFSMFGLIFFPDRAAGFRSLRAALVPGGVAAVSCWPPPSRSTAMLVAIAALGAAFPDAPEPEPPLSPLSSAAQLRLELEQAGFVDVEVREVITTVQPDIESFWRGIAEGYAPLAVARQTMPPEVWAAAEARGLAWLRANHNPSVPLSYVAHIGRGTRPA